MLKILAEEKKNDITGTEWQSMVMSLVKSSFEKAKNCK
jgi:hypothetical protein